MFRNQPEQSLIQEGELTGLMSVVSNHFHILGHVPAREEVDDAELHRRMVVLYGDEKTPAEVRNVTKSGDQTLVGERIRFWIDKEQVEVIKARVPAPVSEGAVPFAPKF